MILQSSLVRTLKGAATKKRRDRASTPVFLAIGAHLTAISPKPLSSCNLVLNS
jgi:hypothetical protein